MGETNIKYVISGESIRLESFKARELAEILSATEDMILSEACKDMPNMRESLTLSLIEISRGSVELVFSPQQPEITIPAFLEVSEKIQMRAFDDLTPKSLKAVQSIQSIAKRKNCIFDFLSVNGTARKVADITPETEVKRTAVVYGETDIYGKVYRVGGNKPTALVNIPGHGTLTCTTNEDTARRLGPLLYTDIGLHGIAMWSTKDFSLIEFEITEILDYKPTPLMNAMAELRGQFGEYFDEIDDPDMYISTLRGDEDE